MTLKEQYDALIAAGMPEHERLCYCLCTGCTGWWQHRGRTAGGVWVDETDARDLITMHALRWVTQEKKWLVTQHETMWRVYKRIHRCGCEDKGVAPDILDAIVQAVTA